MYHKELSSKYVRFHGIFDCRWCDINGNKTWRGDLESAVDKISISIKLEEDAVRTGDIAYINVELVGENGIIECNADTKITVSVEGGELLVFGSANPRTPESYVVGAFTTYYGRVLAVAWVDKAGILRITVVTAIWNRRGRRLRFLNDWECLTDGK
jgi:hypothetical protein